MRHSFISQNGSSRLIVIFAGWGMDERPFRGMTRPGYDILVVWDYRSLDFDPQWTAPYREVCVLAWSMGVQAAQLCHAALGPRVTGRIAVAGTPCPVSDTLGIPCDIFKATADTLSPRTLERFMRRMCGGQLAWSQWSSCAPERPVEELRDELNAIAARPAASAAPRFDHYLLTLRDAIFPPENQRRAFAGCDVVETDSPHLPDFRRILDEYFIDKSLVGERFAGAGTSYDSNAAPQALIADSLAALLDDKDTRAIFARPGSRILEVGCGTGLLTKMLPARCEGATLQLWDVLPQAPFPLPAGSTYRSADAETAVRDVPDASLDMIVSASTIQWFNSPERFVAECLRALRPGGMLALSTFGRDNMPEVSRACGVGLHLCDAATWRTAIAEMPGVETVLLHEARLQCRFGSAMEILRHLSLTGVNAITRSGNARAAAAALQPDADGRFTLTYQPLFMLLRKCERVFNKKC